MAVASVAAVIASCPATHTVYFTRARYPQLLSTLTPDTPATVRRAARGAIAAVALVDLPRRAWPGLIDHILDTSSPMVTEDRLSLVAYIGEDLVRSHAPGPDVGMLHTAHRLAAAVAGPRPSDQRSCHEVAGVRPRLSYA